MPPRQILYSVVGGPSQCMLKACVNTGQKMHFVCRDEHGSIDEFDMSIVGEIQPDNDGTARVVFKARDTGGLEWLMTYDPVEEDGNMMRNFGKSG